TNGHEGNAQALQAGRHITVLQFFADTGQGRNGQRPADTGTDAVDRTFTKGVVTLYHEQYRTHDGAVYGNQRQEHAQRVVQRRYVLIQYHFQNLHHRRDYADIGQQTQEAQIHAGVFFTHPGPGTFFLHVGIDQDIHRCADGQNHHHRNAQTDSGLNFFGDRQESTHTEEEGQRHVLDKYRLNEQTDVMFH